MQIIIPMTGYGSRFVAAGYKDLKPLIQIKGKPIIEWIVKRMYHENDDFIFVCRGEHLDTISDIKNTIYRIAPNAQIVRINNWVKKGNVYDILRASEYIDDDKPCIINYCDFYMIWEYDRFIKDVAERKCDGCIPCYTGFHPHLLIKKNLYASCKTDSEDNLIEIKEKFSFEENKFNAKHSPGNYYFKTGALLKKYCQVLVDSGNDINGEYYASLVYNFMVKDGLNVWVPTNHIKYFCQWGTPEDMSEFLYWINFMH